MKSLNEFLSASSYVEINHNYKGTPLFESYEIEQFESLQEVYEAIFDKLFDEENECLNEGFGSFFGKLAKWGDKADKKISDFKQSVQDKVKSLSDAAKNAIETAKKKAGDAWDKVKDTYTSVVASIDNSLKASKDTIVKFAVNAKMKVDELESKIASIITNAMASGKELGEKLMNILASPVQGTLLVAYFTTALAASKGGIKSDTLLDVLSAAVGNN